MLPMRTGVFKFDGDKWIEVSPNFSKGIHVVYFGNTQCPACMRFDLSWEEFAKRIHKKYDLELWLVRCKWFQNECDSPTAKALFDEYDIVASPTLMIIVDGEVKDRLSGVLESDALETWVKGVLSGRLVLKIDDVSGYSC